MSIATHASPTPFAKPIAMRFAGKENAQCHMRNSRHAPELVYPPQLFYDPTLNPLYNHEFGQPFAFDQRSSDYELDTKPTMTDFSGDFKPNMSVEDAEITSHGGFPQVRASPVQDFVTKSVARGVGGDRDRAYRL